MNSRTRCQRFSIAILAAFGSLCLGTSCGGGGDAAATATTFSIGGTVSGLSGTLVLQNNAGNDLSLTADGTFTFTTALADAATYAVTVLTQPTGQTCTVASGSGTVSGAAITTVAVTCAAGDSATFAIGGTATGLSGTVVLQNNLGNDLTLTADGTFTFTTGLADSATYAVTVLTQPTGQTCSVSAGTGTVSGAAVTSITLTCSADAFTVGGTLSGVSGTVVLQNNAGDNLSLTANGAFTFATAVANGAAYVVTVSTQPSGQTCTVGSGSGTISGAAVTTVTVTCVSLFAVGGTLSGLSGTVVLQNNAGNNLSLTANGAFTFTTTIANGATYAVTVSTQPSSQTCTVGSGSGTISGAAVTSVTVTCTNNSRKMFVTSTTTNGNMNGVDGADALCTAANNKPATGTYKALVVDGNVRIACTTANCGGGIGEHTGWILAASTPYVRTDGTTAIGTTDSNGIFNFSVTANLSAAVGTSSGVVWTGLTTTWGTSADTCSRWTSSSGNGIAGNATATTSDAISFAQGDCSTATVQLICVEQ